MCVMHKVTKDRGHNLFRYHHDGLSVCNGVEMMSKLCQLTEHFEQSN